MMEVSRAGIGGVTAAVCRELGALYLAAAHLVINKRPGQRGDSGPSCFLAWAAGGGKGGIFHLARM